MHTLGYQYILFYFLFQFLVNKTEKSVEFTKSIVFMHKKICRFEIIDGVKYVYCIKHAYKFLLREQVGFAAVHGIIAYVNPGGAPMNKIS